jgi:hypothetical protein
MKIIITESQHFKVQKQEYINNLLDKINKYGIETLTRNEKKFLDNVDDDNAYVYNPIDTVHQVVSILIKNNLIDPDKITSNDEDIAVYGLKDVEFPYFDDGHLLIEPSSTSLEHNDGFSIKGVDYGDDIDVEERNDVFRYIEKKWENVLDEYPDWFFFFVNDPEEED